MSSQPSHRVLLRPRATTSGHYIHDPDPRQPVCATAAPDLQPATALADAALRLHDTRDPQQLLQAVAREALDLVPADGVVILTQERAGPTPVLHLPATTDVDPAAVLTLLRCRRLDAAHQLRPGHTPDLDEHCGRSVSGRPSGADRPWRSLLLADLTSPCGSRSARLLWYGYLPHAFTGTAEAGLLFARHAGLALLAATERHHLEQALHTRTVIGQATGIVMARYQLTADQAFDVLRRYSQHHNIRLCTVAETVVQIGSLPH